jgi:hypothetical protein
MPTVVPLLRPIFPIMITPSVSSHSTGFSTRKFPGIVSTGKHRPWFKTLAAGILLLSCSQQPLIAAETTTKLFNGSDLSGWSHVLVGEGVKKEDVWSSK